MPAVQVKLRPSCGPGYGTVQSPESIPNAVSERTEWIDYAKGIGILLVVVGHVIRGLYPPSILNPDGWAGWVDRWIYSFHMPFFFFVSGLFAVRSICCRTAWQFVVSKLAVIVYPYVLWATFQHLIQVLMSRHTNSPAAMSDWIAILYHPPMQFWFLYILFLALMLVAVLYRAGCGPTGILAVSVILLVLPKCMPLGSWGPVYLLCRFFIYLAMAVALSEFTLVRLARLSRRILLLIAVSGFMLVAMKVTWPGGSARAAGDVIFAMLGIAGTAAMAQLLARRNTADFLRYFGVIALQIYVAHTIMSGGFRIVATALGIDSALIHLVGGVLVGLLGPALLVWMCGRCRLDALFVMPRGLRSVKPKVAPTGSPGTCWRGTSGRSSAEERRMAQQAANGNTGVSATVPDWERERCRTWWDPGRRLLLSIRNYQHWASSSGVFCRLMSRLCVLRHRFWSVVCGTDIPLNCQIAGGLLLPHPNGVVIHSDAVIGPNCLVFQQVTIGTREGSGAPTIGGHVDIGAGAKILGAVTIGDHARIGANAVVVCDVPPGATVVGVPARVISSERREGA